MPFIVGSRSPLRGGHRRYGPTPARPSAEGDEAFQVLDDGAQGELTLHSSEASSPSSRESVLILAYGEEVLASYPSLASDEVPAPKSGTTYSVSPTASFRGG